MNKRKLNKVFEIIKTETNMDYAVTNADEYGDCNSCVNCELADVFGVHSKGIYTKHWLTGMNKGKPWKELNEVYIGHDLTKEQADKMVAILINNGYNVSPMEYDATKSFLISEKSA